MAPRARLRAEQFRDVDVLGEDEHDAWVHRNLVTSGTLNFQDGTISGTGDVYANGFYGDGSNLTNLSTVEAEGYTRWVYTDVVATTTGATIELATDIPANVVEIEVLFNAVSNNTASQPPIVQLGDSGGYETTGYEFKVQYSSSYWEYTDGIYSHEVPNWQSTDILNGTISLIRWSPDEHKWFATLDSLVTTESALRAGHGNKTLSGEITSIRLTTPGGSATFDAGSARIRYKLHTDTYTSTSVQSGCSVKLSGNQTVSSQTTEQIEFDSKVFDLNNEFNTSTHTFTAKQAGYYLITVHHIYNDGVPLDDYFKVDVRKNGTVLWASKLPPGDNRTLTGIDVTGIEYLEEDDYITAYTYHHYTGDRNLDDETNIFIWRLNSAPVDLQGYYTKTEVDNLMTTMSGSLQAQIDELLSL